MEGSRSVTTLAEDYNSLRTFLCEKNQNAYRTALTSPPVIFAAVSAVSIAAIYSFGTQLSSILPSYALAKIAPFIPPQAYALAITVSLVVLCAIYITHKISLAKGKADTAAFIASHPLFQIIPKLVEDVTNAKVALPILRSQIDAELSRNASITEEISSLRTELQNAELEKAQAIQQAEIPLFEKIIRLKRQIANLSGLHDPASPSKLASLPLDDAAADVQAQLAQLTTALGNVSNSSAPSPSTVQQEGTVLGEDVLQRAQDIFGEHITSVILVEKESEDAATSAAFAEKLSPNDSTLKIFKAPTGLFALLTADDTSHLAEVSELFSEEGDKVVQLEKVPGTSIYTDTEQSGSAHGVDSQQGGSSFSGAFRTEAALMENNAGYVPGGAFKGKIAGGGSGLPPWSL